MTKVAQRHKDGNYFNFKGIWKLGQKKLCPPPSYLPDSSRELQVLYLLVSQNLVQLLQQDDLFHLGITKPYSASKPS